ncbi:hypothetical protein DGG96_08320 [Legionella qingyii]|uniref:Uncharacterized protein n=1 Tax=Legionella qingyii TaxID=2184757 RepID=A0A317U4E0_9GAMM|nr:hypothetical protein DGG96_08320 [Legionella qingyii]
MDEMEKRSDVLYEVVKEVSRLAVVTKNFKAGITLDIRLVIAKHLLDAVTIVIIYVEPYVVGVVLQVEVY